MYKYKIHDRNLLSFIGLFSQYCQQDFHLFLKFGNLNFNHYFSSLWKHNIVLNPNIVRHVIIFS